MAEFGARYDEFARAGTAVAALSVDEPARSDWLRRRHGFRFPLLCDPGADVCRAWGLYDPNEKGGIARPAVFVIDDELRVRQHSLDGTATRARAVDVLAAIASPREGGDAALTPRLIVPTIRQMATTVLPALRLTLFRRR